MISIYLSLLKTHIRMRNSHDVQSREVHEQPKAMGDFTGQQFLCIFLSSRPFGEQQLHNRLWRQRARAHWIYTLWRAVGGQAGYRQVQGFDKLQIYRQGMDTETGLMYYGKRYFDAKTSRFISSDPILELYFLTSNYITSY